MIDGIPLGAIGDLSGWVVGAVLVMTGRLIPWWQHNQRIADFKEANTKLELTVARQQRQIEILMGREVSDVDPS